MKIPGRKFALVAGPLVAAAAMLGVPLAGSAQALSRLPNCGVLSAQVSEYYNEAHLDFYDATQANDRGDWLAWGYYSALETQNTQAGDALASYAAIKGC
jgi:hypothetical protein